MPTPVSPRALAAALTEYWSPRVVAELDDSYVKVAKVQGEFVWHAHDDEDELFFILGGALRIELEDGAVELGEGDTWVVPKGVRHRPVAERECLILLIERKRTRHTGNEVSPLTRTLAEQTRALC
jgi:mannose-6-phosphate isomerase-like protein (cupin superfamily)